MIFWTARETRAVRKTEALLKTSLHARPCGHRVLARVVAADLAVHGKGSRLVLDHRFQRLGCRVGGGYHGIDRLAIARQAGRTGLACRPVRPRRSRHTRHGEHKRHSHDLSHLISCRRLATTAAIDRAATIHLALGAISADANAGLNADTP